MIKPQHSLTTLALATVLTSATLPAFANEPAATALISGEGFQVTTDMVDAELRFRPKLQSQQIRLNDGALRELIDDFYRREAVVAESQRERVWENPADAYRLERARKEELLAIMLDRQRAKLLASLPDFTAKAQETFLANQANYQIPETVNVAHILLMAKTDEDKTKRRAEAEAILARVRKGEDFGQLAKQLSEDRGSAAAGGQLGYFPRGRMVPAFEQAAFALKAPGDLSEIITTQFGLHIIRLDGKQPAKTQTFDAVKDSIIAGLKQSYVRDKLRDWYQQMTDPSRIKADQAAIDGYIKRTVEAAKQEPQLTIPSGDKIAPGGNKK
ncbi:peptidylprolyl isomerase [Thiospirillum jenense]|uniref:peptidylprolyl isomerase n=1 Tax=Thiospirillum jenense TaxID=1653858 RepID=A0A839HCI1_9GAMM|nr:peptidylprolyl isomerase [Thiospirillum jenense]MBB1124907.1 peptidylprolyl isomerase [Thiospirillum jenense]